MICLMNLGKRKSDVARAAGEIRRDGERAIARWASAIWGSFFFFFAPSAALVLLLLLLLRLLLLLLLYCYIANVLPLPLAG